jgi:hypothetical protein
MLLRNTKPGKLEIYDIGNNQIIGAVPLGSVELKWQVGGFAVDPPTVSGTFMDSSSDQLVQPRAGFGGGSGAVDGLATVPPSADRAAVADDGRRRCCSKS